MNITFTDKYILYLSPKSDKSKRDVITSREIWEGVIIKEINRKYSKDDNGDEIDILKIKSSKDILNLLVILDIDIKKYWLFEVQRVTYENKTVRGIQRSDVVAKSIVFRTGLDQKCFKMIDGDL